MNCEYWSILSIKLVFCLASHSEETFDNYICFYLDIPSNNEPDDENIVAANENGETEKLESNTAKSSRALRRAKLKANRKKDVPVENTSTESIEKDTRPIVANNTTG